jgi:hypothetical protein
MEGAMSDDANRRFEALSAQRHEIVEALAAQVRQCVARSDTDHDVFHGCIDWHSAAHGFWALTAAARVAGRDDLGAYVRDRLTPAGIAREQALLARRPGFEMPYGRAWFLRLAIEFERAFADARLAAMADDAAASLKRWFEERPADPDALSYDSAAWALINLRAWGRHRGDAALVAFVDAIVQTRFVPFEAACDATRDERRRSFMAGCTNRAWLVSEVLPRAEFIAWLARFLPDPQALAPVTAPANPHLYGLDFSRAWGLWRLFRKSGDVRYLDLYVAHVSIAYEHPQWWRGSYEAVGHWVAQFGMFAAMPLFDEDYW